MVQNFTIFADRSASVKIKTMGTTIMTVQTSVQSRPSEMPQAEEERAVTKASISLAR